MASVLYTVYVYLLSTHFHSHIQADCIPLLHLCYPRNHHIQCPILHSHISQWYPLKVGLRQTTLCHLQYKVALCVCVCVCEQQKCYEIVYQDITQIGHLHNQDTSSICQHTFTCMLLNLFSSLPP